METLVYQLLIIGLSTMLIFKTIDILLLLWLRHEHKKGNLDINEILNNKNTEVIPQKNKNTIIMILDKNEDGYFAYDDSNHFLANGKTISQLEKRFAERFPGIIAKIVDKKSNDIFITAQIEERKKQILKLMRDNNLKTAEDIIAFAKKLDKDS